MMRLHYYLTNLIELYNFMERSLRSTSSQMTHQKDVTPFNMLINQLQQRDMGNKVQTIVYVDELVIHGGPVGDSMFYHQMISALKKMENEAVRLGLKFSPAKCGAIWYRSNNSDWHFKITR